MDLNRALDLNINGATISAQAGFTADQLIKITSSNVRIFGPGTVDGTNLPAITAGYDGTNFKGITIRAVGASAADNKTGIVLDGFHTIAGMGGGVLAQYCPGIIALDLTADASNNSATYAACTTIAFSSCPDSIVSNIRSTKAKWKAFEIRNSANWVCGNVYAETSAADQCGVFFVGCEKGVATGIATTGGFGIKADSCSDTLISGVNIDADAVGSGGVFLQGCTKTALRGGIVRGFTSYGVIVGPHTTKGNLSIDCEVDGIQIHGSGVAGDGSAGIYIAADDVYGTYGTVLSDNLIRTVSCGILINDDTTTLHDNTRIVANRFKDIKNYFINGPATSLAILQNKFEDSTGITQGIAVWSDGAGTRLLIEGNEALAMGTAANFIQLVGSTTTPLQYDQVTVKDNAITSAARLLNVALQTSVQRIRNLQIMGNTSMGGASATNITMTNSGTTNVQVLVVGNMALAADGVTKQAINFAETAASGKWNGVVENNLATVTNKPNNV